MHIVGVIGSPVAHSLSPLLHNTAFAALGLDGSWRSFAFEIAPGHAAGALEAVRRAEVTGLSVTMPHKADVAAMVDECSDVARRLGAVNCVLRRDGSLFGTNTDGEGFVSSLARGAGFDPAGTPLRRHRGRRGGAGRRAGVGGGRRGAGGGREPHPRAGLRGGGAGRPGRHGRAPHGRRHRRGRGRGRPGGQRHPRGDGRGRRCPGGPWEHGGRGGWSPPDLLGPGPGRGRPDLCAAARRRGCGRRRIGVRPCSTDSGCSCTRRRRSSCLWTGVDPPVEAMWRAAEAASPEDTGT